MKALTSKTNSESQLLSDHFSEMQKSGQLTGASLCRGAPSSKGGIERRDGSTNSFHSSRSASS